MISQEIQSEIENRLKSKLGITEIYAADGAIKGKAVADLLSEAIQKGADMLPHNARTLSYGGYMDAFCHLYPEAVAGPDRISYQQGHVFFSTDKKRSHMYAEFQPSGVIVDFVLMDCEAFACLPELLAYAQARFNDLYLTPTRFEEEKERREAREQALKEANHRKKMREWGRKLYDDMCWNVLYESKTEEELFRGIKECEIMKATDMAKGLDEATAETAFTEAVQSGFRNFLEAKERKYQESVKEACARKEGKEELKERFMTDFGPMFHSVSSYIPVSLEDEWKKFWKSFSAHARYMIKKESAEDAVIEAMSTEDMKVIADRGWDFRHKAPSYGEPYYRIEMKLVDGTAILFRIPPGVTPRRITEAARVIIPAIDSLAQLVSRRFKTVHPVRFPSGRVLVQEGFPDTVLKAVEKSGMPVTVWKSDSRLEVTYFFERSEWTACLPMRFRIPKSEEELLAIVGAFLNFAETDAKFRQEIPGLRYDIRTV